MTDDIDKIERDRKRRERELLLLLLLLGLQARRYVTHAVRIGADPVGVLRAVWLGDGRHFPGSVTPIANAMADAHTAGYRRTLDIGGLAKESPDLAASAYMPAAQNAALLALDTMSGRLRAVLAADLTPAGRILALRQAFTEGGWLPGKPYALEQLTGLQIVASYGAGMMQAAFATPEIWGFEYVTMRDERVRPNHRAMDRVQRPKNDPVWRIWNPPCGFNCRCLLMPRRNGQPTPVLPDVMPDPGWVGPWAGSIAA